jgi:hypothetical protein
MSNVTCLWTQWQLAAEASDRITELMDNIPGWDGYEHAAETQDELRRAVVLLREAIPLLERASAREAARCTEYGSS